MTVFVKKIGGSLGIVIPKAVARDMQLAEGTPLQVSGTPDAIVIRRQHRRPRTPLKRIVARLKPSAYRRRRDELSAQGPVGKEIW